MKKNNLKKISLLVILLTLLTLSSNITLASEVTGTLSTGISSSLGNVLTGTVVVPPNPTPTGGNGGGGRSSSQLALNNQTNQTDINNDNVVDILDFVYLIANWGLTGTNVSGDINTDGRVDILDFVIMMANWTI
jgi:hypothetical protein